MDHFITKYDVICPPGAKSAVLEDSIMHKGYPATAGSKILKNFISPLDATVLTRLEAAGITILGKTKMDEFGAAGLFKTEERSTVVAAPIPSSLRDAEGGAAIHVSGSAHEAPIPSSLRGAEGGAAIHVSGAVAAVAESKATFALCNDYTGAVRQQAAEHGLYYLRPTYGTVSRYGLIPAVPSMDQIGVVCKTPEDGLHALSIIAGHDPKDGAMLPASPIGSLYHPCKTTGAGDLKPNGSIRIGVPIDIIEQITGSVAADAVTEFIKNFENVDITIQHFDVYAQVMQILCCAELSSSLTRYDGIKYGYRADGFSDLHELYTKSRTQAIGADAKLASMLGAMVLSQDYYYKLYDKAMRIRRLIKDSLEFEKYDMIILPIAGRIPAAIANASPTDPTTPATPASPTSPTNHSSPTTPATPTSPTNHSSPTTPASPTSPTNHSSPTTTVTDPTNPVTPTGLALHALPQLCGLPSVTVPYCGSGMTLIADVACEEILISALKAVGL